jgi:asparagine synthase (glutamine-hydrolysing)
MCGIAGIAGGNPDRHEISKMLAYIRHRGPDGCGTHVAGNVALGNVRLAIVDATPAGDQPMISPDGRYVLVYNGELYNHLDFRSSLAAAGVRFKGYSDTETLLWLLVRHGEAVLPLLNGIFAFAFHDTVNRELLLARDHMGVKPLYHTRGKEGRLLFASEIKSLFANGECAPRLNTSDLAELFMFHFIAGERTAFANVSELSPGHVLRWCEGATKISRFWDPVPTEIAAANGNDNGGHLRELVRAGVKRQLMSDDPVGIMCSGGVDSGMVAAFAGLEPGAISSGFCFRDPAHGYDELQDARSICSPHAISVEEVQLPEADVPDLLWDVTWFYDEPIPRPHHLAAYAVARAARSSGLKVLLSGEGGDELFGGYQRYVDIAEQVATTGDLSALVFGHNRVALPRLMRFWPEATFSSLFRERCSEETCGLDIINRQLLIDQKTFLQHFLQRSDRMGMAASIEMRVPLLDLELVKYMNQRPGSEKICGRMTKVGLKAAARGVLPAMVVDRPKQPFDMPMAPLLQRGPMADFLDDMLLSSPRCGAIFNPKAIGAMVLDLRRGAEDLWKIVWMLLTTEVWMRVFEVSV